MGLVIHAHSPGRMWEHAFQIPLYYHLEILNRMPLINVALGFGPPQVTRGSMIMFAKTVTPGKNIANAKTYFEIKSCIQARKKWKILPFDVTSN